MIFFTICSRNFAGYTGALWSSLRSVYPDVKFHMVLCDEIDNFDYASLRHPLVKILELGINSFESMKERYNITELNTALKPFAFSYLFEKYPGEIIIYLDPDIFVVSQFLELEECFAGGADCVLTPHITEPSEFAEMSDLEFLKYGIYNFGFCALRDTPETRRLVAWWGRRLEEFCSIDFNRGLFVDQKWGDYFPAFIQRTSILRHPGYNLAYWNLAQRRLSRNAAGAWQVNGLMLRFVHFSGNRIEDEDLFTRHAGQFTLDNTPLLRDLLDTYKKLVFENGHSYYCTIPYGFSWSGITGKNEHTPEHLKRQSDSGQTVSPYLPLIEYNSFLQFNKDRVFNYKNLIERTVIESTTIAVDEIISSAGFCAICKSSRNFITSSMYNLGLKPDGGYSPNWREHMVCDTCGFVNRIRGVLTVLDQILLLDNNPAVYITEQVTPLYELLSRRLSKIIGSEYIGEGILPGTIINDIQHEDIQNLSFLENQFDLILSFDVLEHVPFPEQAFTEIYRCLKGNGNFIFTVPFSFTDTKDKIRAKISSDGSIEHLLPPEYHGNPLNMEEGALCFRYFSWDVIDVLKKCGFREAKVITYWSDTLKNYADPQIILHASK